MKNKKLLLQLGLICIAFAFVGYGAFRGEVSTVLTKAIRLCLECVGIG